MYKGFNGRTTGKKGVRMEDTYRRSSHSVTQLRYHIVLVTKYRRPLLTGNIKDTVRAECKRIIEHMDGSVISMETDVDHIHILAGLSPKHAVSDVINVLKGVSARIARRDHGEEIGKYLRGNAFWSPSYFAATTGGVTLDVVKAYVESQKSDEHQDMRKKRCRLHPLPSLQR